MRRGGVCRRICREWVCLGLGCTRVDAILGNSLICIIEVLLGGPGMM
jgi:hypothetical protein